MICLIDQNSARILDVFSLRIFCINIFLIAAQLFPPSACSYRVSQLEDQQIPILFKLTTNLLT